MLLYQIGGKLLECVCERVVDEVESRITSDDTKNTDIGVEAAHNISMIVNHISRFEILSNDLEYMTRNIKIWKKFIKLGDILHKDQTLNSLTSELNQGEFDCFTQKILEKLICALFDDSEKRKKFIRGIKIMLDS